MKYFSAALTFGFGLGSAIAFAAKFGIWPGLAIVACGTIVALAIVGHREKTKFPEERATELIIRRISSYVKLDGNTEAVAANIREVIKQAIRDASRYGGPLNKR